MYKYLCTSILVLENTSHSNHTVLQYYCAHQYHRSDTDNHPSDNNPFPSDVKLFFKFLGQKKVISTDEEHVGPIGEIEEVVEDEDKNEDVGAGVDAKVNIENSRNVGAPVGKSHAISEDGDSGSVAGFLDELWE